MTSPHSTTLCPSTHRSCPGTCLVWLHVKAGVIPLGPSCTHPSWGSGVLSPETQDQLLPLVPPSPCHLTGPLPLPSCVVLGQLLTCFPSAVSGAACPWPPGGSSRRRLAWPRAALPHWPLLALLRPHSPAQRRRPGGAAGVLQGLLTTCFRLWRGPAAASGPCSAGPAREAQRRAGSSSGSGRLLQPHLNSQLLCGAFTCRHRRKL